MAAAIVHAEGVDPAHELLVAARADDPNHPIAMVGKKELFEKRGSPASTIKVALTLMGLEEKVITLQSTYVCEDRTSLPSKLTLQQAMTLSSNDFFEQLVLNLGIPSLEKYLNRWNYFPLVEKGLPPPPRITRGKAFLVSPQDELMFLSKLATRKVEGISENTYDQLEQVISQADKPSIYGKTGSDLEGSWFVAYGHKPSAMIYVLRSDIPNSDGKRLRKLLFDYIDTNARTDAKN